MMHEPTVVEEEDMESIGNISENRREHQRSNIQWEWNPKGQNLGSPPKVNLIIHHISLHQSNCHLGLMKEGIKFRRKKEI